ncbi:MAG: MarR family winged helix-turn-helix transcriptional regulator [Bacteroidota bacterium]|jgi:DNA-binding MarR family transcriptional regulator
MKKPSLYYKTPEASTGFLLWKATQLWQRGVKNALDEYKLTHSQFVTLASILSLREKNEEVTQSMLSSHTRMDAMTVSIVMRTLQRKKLIKRSKHSFDTRAKSIELTAQGEKVCTAAISKVERFDKDFFEMNAKTSRDFNDRLLQMVSQLN